MQGTLASLSLLLLLAGTIASPAKHHGERSDWDKCDCGSSSLSRARIVGGRSAKDGEFPWMAGVWIITNETPEGSNGFICGGAIISPEWVLTAHHCVAGGSKSHSNASESRDSSYPIHVHVGNVNLFDGTKYEVEETIPWPENDLRWDVALLKIKGSIKLNHKVKPICLPYEFANYPDWTGKAWASGFGMTEDGESPQSGGQPSMTLNKARMRVISNERCKEVYKRYTSNPYAVQDPQVCTLNRDKSMCYGDSGSTLAAQLSNGKWSTFGVTSNGPTFECSAGAPSMFSRVTAVLGWIEQETGQEFCRH